jgi:hypothetical protein
MHTIYYNITQVPRAWLLPGPSLPPLTNTSTLYRSTVFGPTCDSLDVVFRYKHAHTLYDTAANTIHKSRSEVTQLHKLYT